MKLLISFLIFLIFISSCQYKTEHNVINNINQINDGIIEKIDKEDNKKIRKVSKIINDKPLYIVGKPYFINGVRYIPKENYSYSEKGLATFYGKELHKVKTINNELNKVTELFGRHKTLPIPSIVKITNLDNGLSLIIRINDRHNDNTSLVQVSRKVAQLLRFYKSKIAKVKIEILSDASKQTKVVIKSMSDPLFDETLKAVPTEKVFETDLNDSTKNSTQIEKKYEDPIEIGFEKTNNEKLYIKIFGFYSYDEAKNIIVELEISSKTTIEKENGLYNIILGPIVDIDVNNLVSSFISKGYKETKIIIN